MIIRPYNKLIAMKNLILIITFFITIATSAQQHILPDKQQIIQVLKVQQESWNEGDIEGFMNGYWHSDSLIFIGKRYYQGLAANIG